MLTARMGRCWPSPIVGEGRESLETRQIMVNYISGLVFVVLLLIGIATIAPFAEGQPLLATLIGIVWLVADLILASAIQLAAQWQRAVVFRLGKYKELKGP